MLKAVIFDMDGVLVDSEAFICKAAMKMFEEKGFKVNKEDFMPFVGTGENKYLGGVAQKYGIVIDIDRDKARTYAIYDEIVKGKITALPGVHDFIANVKKNGLKAAVASSADALKVRINLREIGMSEETFDAIICAEDVEHKKPAPDIFLAAAKKIGVEPSDCLVVEDAITGITAAKTAGMRCLALTTSFAKAQLYQADFIAENLADEKTLLVLDCA